MLLFLPYVLFCLSGWSTPLEGFLYRRPKGKLRLLTDFSTSFDDLWVEDMTVRVVLPEGASNIKCTVRLDYNITHLQCVAHASSSEGQAAPLLKYFDQDQVHITALRGHWLSGKCAVSSGSQPLGWLPA